MIETFASIGEAGEVVAELLATELQGWLTTVDADGTPQPTTVWFHRDGETIVVYSRPGKPKLRNIAARHRVAFHLNSDRHGERWMVMVGEAAADPALPPLDENPGYMAKYRAALDHWGFDVGEVAAAYRVPVRINPSAVRIRVR